MDEQTLNNTIQRLSKWLYALLFLALIALQSLSVFASFLIANEAANQAASLVRRTVVKDFREAVYTLEEAKLSYFKAVIYFDQDSKRVFSLPASLDDFESEQSFVDRLTMGKIKVPMYFDDSRMKSIGTVVFVYHRFSNSWAAFGIWLCLALLMMPYSRFARKKVTENFKRELAMKEQNFRVDVATRVKHDIASPLSALQMVADALQDEQEEHRKLIKSAAKRLTEIVKDLEMTTQDQLTSLMMQQTKVGSHLVQHVLTEIFDEKSVRLGPNSNVVIKLDCTEVKDGRAAIFDLAELKRSLSNIVENAIEACVNGGEVNIVARDGKSFVSIDVVDNGIGISPSDFDKISKKGFTKGKASGSGIGLHYAKRSIESWGGRLEFSSANNVTRFTIELLKATSQ